MAINKDQAEVLAFLKLFQDKPKLDRLEILHNLAINNLAKMCYEEDPKAGQFSIALPRIREELMAEKELAGLTADKSLTIVFKSYEDIKDEIGAESAGMG